MANANFTFKTAAKNLSAEKAIHKFLALQKSGQYSEMRILPAGRSRTKFNIGGYKWPTRKARRKYKVGKTSNPSKSRHMEIANIIAQQIPVYVKMELGARDFMGVDGRHYPGQVYEGGLKFTVTGKGVNRILIMLTGLDLYDIYFLKIKKFSFDTVSSVEGIYFDQLPEVLIRGAGLKMTGVTNPKPPMVRINWNELPPLERAASLIYAEGIGKIAYLYTPKNNIMLSRPDLKIINALHYKQMPDFVIDMFDREMMDWFEQMKPHLSTAPGYYYNPNQDEGPTANQVYFAQYGKSKVGWINRETPTRYQITYKVNGRTRSVWRLKSQVKFLLPKKRRGNPTWPCPTAKNPSGDRALAQAAKRSKDFYGFDPRRVRQVNLQFPKALALVGAAARIDYKSDKFDGKQRIYFHDFKCPVQIFMSEKKQPNGDEILILKGRFRITPRGIVG
ncbi:MAG: hypothetical protein ACYTBJ_06780 [Planctomycetota bacterium]|jgi:hypothetical protein